MFAVSFRDFDGEYVIAPRWGSIDEPELEPVVFFHAERVIERFCRSGSIEHHLWALLETSSWMGSALPLEQLALFALERGDIRVMRSNRAPVALGGGASEQREESEPEQIAPPVAHWIQIEVVDDEGLPLPNVVYELTLPDRRVLLGRTNDQGVAYVADLDPGQCTLRLPYFHEEAWKVA